VVHNLLVGLDLDSLSDQRLFASVFSFVYVILEGQVQIKLHFSAVFSFKAKTIDYVALALLI